jgi:RNA polymerase sigma factor (sigma-70 family)
MDTQDDSATLATLVTRSAAGDTRATGEIVQRCDPMVRAVVRRQGVNRCDADDVVQDVWLALAQNVHRINSPTALRGWLITVTKHAVGRAHRRNCRQVPTPDAVDWPANDDTEREGMRALERSEARIGIDRALGRLRPADRRLLEVLAASDRPHYRAVSHLVDRPVGSIGPTRQRVIARLRSDPSIRALR